VAEVFFTLPARDRLLPVLFGGVVFFCGVGSGVALGVGAGAGAGE